MKKDLEDIGVVARAKRPLHRPLVLTREEVRGVLGALQGTALLGALLYGTGMRLMEGLRHPHGAGAFEP